MGDMEPARYQYGTRTAIILTAVAMTLCVASLLFPLYAITDHDLHPSSRYYYTDYLRIGDRSYAAYDYHSMAVAFMDTLEIMIAFWLIMGAIYLTMCVLDASALVAGTILQAACLIPIVYSVARIPSVLETDDFMGATLSESSDVFSLTWGPSSGWYLLLLACILQFAAIMRRNAPMIAMILTNLLNRKRGEERTGESEKT